MSALKTFFLPILACLAAPALAGGVDITVDEAERMVGAQVTTIDNVPLGELIAVQTGPKGCSLTIVKLHERLEMQTSPLQVIGLQVDENGKLFVTDASTDLERIIGIPF
ncbi:MAG: hypothetical protein AAF366_10625 [Pseudomonadota bacterium]